MGRLINFPSLQHVTAGYFTFFMHWLVKWWNYTSLVLQNTQLNWVEPGRRPGEAKAQRAVIAPVSIILNRFLVFLSSVHKNCQKYFENLQKYLTGAQKLRKIFLMTQKLAKIFQKLRKISEIGEKWVFLASFWPILGIKHGKSAP